MKTLSLIPKNTNTSPRKPEMIEKTICTPTRQRAATTYAHTQTRETVHQASAPCYSSYSTTTTTVESVHHSAMKSAFHENLLAYIHVLTTGGRGGGGKGGAAGYPSCQLLPAGRMIKHHRDVIANFWQPLKTNDRRDFVVFAGGINQSPEKILVIMSEIFLRVRDTKR